MGRRFTTDCIRLISCRPSCGPSKVLIADTALFVSSFNPPEPTCTTRELFYHLAGITIGPNSCFLSSAVGVECLAYRAIDSEKTATRIVEAAGQRHGPIETPGEPPCAVVTVVPIFLS
jgi:hypothetical protein